MTTLKQCCATGSLHTGTPTGRVEKVHGLDCYIADAPSGSPKGIIVILPDGLGWTFPNNRILADTYAQKGNYDVYLPEFMDGVCIPAEAIISFKAMQATGFWNQIYKIKHMLYLMTYLIPFSIWCRPAVTKPRVNDFFKALKNNEAADLPVACAGFCWGGPFVAELCWDQMKSDNGKRLVECGFTAHPSSLKYPGDIEMVLLPLSIAAAEHDFMMTPENAKQTKEILTAKTAKTKDQGVEHEFIMYDGAHHGFAVRADEDEKLEAEQGLKAEKQALDWFSRWLSNPSPVVAS